MLPRCDAEILDCHIVMDNSVYCALSDKFKFVAGQSFTLFAYETLLWSTAIGFPHHLSSLKALPNKFIAFERTEFVVDFGCEVFSAPKFIAFGQLLIPVIQDASTSMFRGMAVFTSIGSIDAEVSFDGIQKFRSSLTISIQSAKTMSFLSPTLGPVRGGTSIYVSPISKPAIRCIFGDSNVSVQATLDVLRSQYKCVTPAVNKPGEISVTVVLLQRDEDLIAVFMFHEDISIFSVYPQTASSGETITVEGSGFQVSSSIFCHFGSQIFMGTVISPFHCKCVVPSGNRDGILRE
jgi:hypothetical protein